jgi:penicillin G amidase
MVKKTLIILGLTILVIAAGFYLYLRRYLPDYDAELKIPGLKETVLVERNRFAVPTITARNDDDLYFAWGYVNAQDRMFQLEFTRRIAQGRISEFAGASALEKDLFLQAVGFYEMSQREFSRMSPAVQRYLQRYVDGINHYLETEGSTLYMKLLGLKPEPWVPADAFSVAMMLNWSLAYNMKHELLYQGIIGRIGLEKAANLLNLVPAGTPTIIDDQVGPFLDDQSLASLFRRFDSLLGCRSASNNWAIAPSKTAYPGAILSTDMQVHDSKLPNDFYLIHVKTDDYEAAGAQVMGLPFIASGYNRHFAWGLTNNGADMVDLFKETIDRKKGTYRFQGEEYPLGQKEIEIRVKGQDPVRKTIYYVEHKPILNDAFPELTFDVSLDWTGFDTINVEGFFHLNRAQNQAEFIAGAEMIRMSPQNMVYADIDGNIGFRIIGSLPLRRKGTGSFIQDGTLARRNWDGNIPNEDYPQIVNPERGFIATANNKVVKDFRYDVNGTYSPGYRYENIVRLLRDRAEIDDFYVRKMQTNTFSLLAQKVQALMRKHIIPQSALERQALETVLDWDGYNEKEAVAPGIYNTFYVRLAYHLLFDEIGPELATEYIAERYISQERIFQLIANNSDFIDDRTTAARETLDDIVNRAFAETVTMLETFFDSDNVSTWQWGRMHQIRFDHVLGSSALLRRFVNYGPFPFEGDSETNNRARFYEVEPPFVAGLASAPRIVVRFDPEPRGSMMLITGQNEYFLSDHATDMTDAWRRHEFFSLEEEPVRYRMTMKPPF